MSATAGESQAVCEEGQAWPFVVTRKRCVDWQPMVAPGFMSARGGEYLLVHAADPGDAPCPSPVFERIVTTKRYGDLTLVARSLPATADLVGGPPAEHLRDQAGRPIHLIEGLVLRGRQPGAASLWEHQLTSVDAIAHQAFPEFWRSEEEMAAPVSSAPLTRPRPGDSAQAPEGADSTDGARGSQPGETGRASIAGGGHGTTSVRDVMIMAILLIAGVAARQILVHVIRHASRGCRGL